MNAMRMLMIVTICTNLILVAVTVLVERTSTIAVNALFNYTILADNSRASRNGQLRGIFVDWSLAC